MNCLGYVLAYFAIGLFFGALKLLGNSIRGAYRTGNLPTQRFMDHIVVLLRHLFLWPFLLFKSRFR